MDTICKTHQILNLDFSSSSLFQLEYFRGSNVGFARLFGCLLLLFLRNVIISKIDICVIVSVQDEFALTM